MSGWMMSYSPSPSLEIPCLVRSLWRQNFWHGDCTGETMFDKALFTKQATMYKMMLLWEMIWCYQCTMCNCLFDPRFHSTTYLQAISPTFTAQHRWQSNGRWNWAARYRFCRGGVYSSREFGIREHLRGAPPARLFASHQLRGRKGLFEAWLHQDRLEDHHGIRKVSGMSLVKLNFILQSVTDNSNVPFIIIKEWCIILLNKECWLMELLQKYLPVCRI